MYKKVINPPFNCIQKYIRCQTKVLFFSWFDPESPYLGPTTRHTGLCGKLSMDSKSKEWTL